MPILCSDIRLLNWQSYQPSRPSQLKYTFVFCLLHSVQFKRYNLFHTSSAPRKKASRHDQYSTLTLSCGGDRMPMTYHISQGRTPHEERCLQRSIFVTYICFTLHKILSHHSVVKTKLWLAYLHLLSLDSLSVSTFVSHDGDELKRQ